MTSSIARSTRLRRLAPAILIATAAFGAVAGASMEAAGVALGDAEPMRRRAVRSTAPAERIH